MVSVARWLETFTCSKYADRFEQLGYSTLQSICQLTTVQLQNLGISPSDISIIMENVLLLRQIVHSLNTPRYLDLTSEPPPSIPEMIHSYSSSNISNPHPLESLERLVYLSESHVIDPKTLVNESSSNFPIISNLLTKQNPLPSITSLQQKYHF